MKKILWFWLVALIVKLALAAWLPLTSDEAYYWVWSHHLQLSYFDHPGMVAWLLWLGHGFEGWLQAVRWPAVLLAHLTILVWLYALKPFLSRRQLWWFFILLLFNPLTGPGSLIVTPDLPMLFFWACAILCWRKILDTQSATWYLLFGLALGLGFSSKYPIVIFVPILLAWILWERRWYLCKPGKVTLTLVSGLVGSMPVLWWNGNHHFVSFAFQLHHGLGGGSWNPWWSLDYIGAQVLLIFPVIFILALRHMGRTRPSWLTFFAWGPLIFFGLTSFKGMTEANWPIAAYPAMLALAAMTVSSRGFQWLKITVVIWVVALVTVLTQIIHPFFPPIAHLDWRFNDQRLYGQVEAQVRDHQPFYASTYQMASQLSFALKMPIAKLRGVGRRDFFDQIPESLPQSKVYFLAAAPNTPLPPELSRRGDREVKWTPIDKVYDLIEVKRR